MQGCPSPARLELLPFLLSGQTPEWWNGAGVEDLAGPCLALGQVSPAVPFNPLVPFSSCTPLFVLALDKGPLFLNIVVKSWFLELQVKTKKLAHDYEILFTLYPKFVKEILTY